MRRHFLALGRQWRKGATFLTAMLGDERFSVDRLVDAAANGIEGLGFSVTDRQCSHKLEKVGGYTVLRQPAGLELPVRQAWMLRAASLRGSPGGHQHRHAPLSDRHLGLGSFAQT